MTAAKTIASEELDRRFDEGKDMTPYMKLETAHFPGREDEVRKVSARCTYKPKAANNSSSFL